MSTLRLLSLDARALPKDRAVLATLITAERPDLVCVHGGPSGLRWPQRCADLARRTGLVVVTGGRPAGGVLVLSTLGVDVELIRDLRLPGRPLAGAALAALRHRGSGIVLAAAQLAAATQGSEVVGAAASLVPGDVPLVLSVTGEVDGVFGVGRAAVADTVYLDPRIGVGACQARSGDAPSVLLELTLP